jgi:autotransporter-associated beta strand protein
MTAPEFPLNRSRLAFTVAATAGLWLIANGATARAATIEQGNASASLGPAFFVDDATTGGGDVTVTQPAVGAYIRSFAGLLTAHQGLSRVTLTGFGFATSTAAAENTATSLTLTFIYLGADEAVGGGDDVILGSAPGNYAYSGSGEYVFAFDTPITAELDITGDRFRIEVAPANGTNDGKIRFKTGPLTYEATNGPKLSVAGSVAPQRLNLAKFQPVITSSVNGQRLATYVTDGVAGNDNRWQSNGPGPHWAQVVFPFPVQIGSAQVFSGVDDLDSQANFKIQYLDGSSWTDVPGASLTGNTDVERILEFTDPVTATSFRLLSPDPVVNIRELALYPPHSGNAFPLGTDVTLNLAHQRPAVATASSAGNFALLAVDGRVNKDSMWQTSTAGSQALEIDLRVGTRIGSAHLYSGSPGVSPLADFVLKYWDGSSWQDIPGGTVTGNTSAALVVPFTSGVTTSKVRLEFANPGTTSVRELCIFPANTGNSGYPLGTNVIGAAPSTAKFDDYNDAFYKIIQPSANRFVTVNQGSPVLSQAGPDSELSHYQVLLNLSTGTYRLRNRMSGHCLSGAQLSTDPGDPLVDAPYSALPHQDWILDPLDGTDFRLINQWSGLVIDTQGGGTGEGTALVQNTANGSATQRWRMEFSTHYPKKGVGGTGFAKVFNVNWAYNWGHQNSSSLPAGAVFHPMQWGDFNWSIGSNQGPLWQYYSTWRGKGEGIYLLGFNEPDGFDQAGRFLDPNHPTSAAGFSWERSMAEAVMLWPRLQAMDLPLASPAPANMNGGWLAAFYTQAASLGYRVDCTAIHTYPGPGGGSSNGLFNTIQSAYNTWGRPVWLTEFSFVNWNGSGTWTEEDNYNCLAEFLWRAEGLPWFRKYALFRFKEDAENPAPAQPWSPVGPRSNAYDLNDKLTPFGELYASWDNDATVRTQKIYHIHNKSTRKRLATTPGATPDARSIRVGDTSVKWTLVPAPTPNLHYITSAGDGRRLIYVNDGSVGLVAADTTGSAVEWSLTEDQYGWFYVGHPASSRRLQLAYNNSTGTATYTMATGTTTGNALLWRFIVAPPPPAWSGAIDPSWTQAGNWTTSTVPVSGDPVAFNQSSTANLNTELNQDFSITGVTVTDPAGSVSIAGTHNLTIGGNGLDLAGASQDLEITAPVVLGAAQDWSVANGRILAVNGGITGSFPLTVTGAGIVSVGGAMDPLTPVTVNTGSTLKTGASYVLSSDPSSVSLTLQGTLDLNGTSQSVNFLTGSGIIDNTAAGPAVLALGNHDAGGTLNALLQNTGGPLALVKNGSANLTLPNAQTHGGGFTNHGTGTVFAQNSAAFGSGPVVMNGSTIYATAGSYTFANALALHGATLRVGGGNNRTLTWNGPVTATGSSGLSADGGTGGITLGGDLDIAGATFTSFANGTTHQINGIISGADGNLTVTGGTLQLSGDNTYGGNTTVSGSTTLRLTTTGTLPASGNVIINGNGNLNIRNTTAWTHNGTITGDGGGSINLNSGTNATLAGNISGVSSINANHAGTDTTISGAISGAANLTVQNSVDANGLGAILRLAGANSYSGTTTVTRGSLVLAAGNVLPDTSPVSIGTATLDTATFTDTAGTLNVTGAATIHLGAGAALAFADSSGVAWNGSALQISGAFVAGSSLRFGNTNGGLTPEQLSLITVNGGGGPFTLDPAGYLTTVTVAAPYDLWAAQIADPDQRDREDDADGDGFNNLQEFLFGTSPTSVNGSLVSTTSSGGNLVLRWLQRKSGATYSLKQSITLAAESWTTVVSPVPVLDEDQSGAPVDYESFTVTLPVSGGIRFFRIEATEED